MYGSRSRIQSLGFILQQTSKTAFAPNLSWRYSNASGHEIFDFPLAPPPRTGLTRRRAELYTLLTNHFSLATLRELQQSIERN